MSVQDSNLPLTLKSDQKLCINAIFSILDISIVMTQEIVKRLCQLMKGGNFYLKG